MKQPGPGRLQLSDERRETILAQLKGLYAETFEDELSTYRAERVLEFFLRTLGPSVYNQAIQDARGFLAEKLDDLDAEFYEVENESPARE